MQLIEGEINRWKKDRSGSSGRQPKLIHAFSLHCLKRIHGTKIWKWTRKTKATEIPVYKIDRQKKKKKVKIYEIRY